MDALTDKVVVYISNGRFRLLGRYAACGENTCTIGSYVFTRLPNSKMDKLLDDQRFIFRDAWRSAKAILKSQGIDLPDEAAGHDTHDGDPASLYSRHDRDQQTLPPRLEIISQRQSTTGNSVKKIHCDYYGLDEMKRLNGTFEALADDATFGVAARCMLQIIKDDMADYKASPQNYRYVQDLKS